MWHLEGILQPIMFILEIKTENKQAYQHPNYKVKKNRINFQIYKRKKIINKMNNLWKRSYRRGINKTKSFCLKALRNGQISERITKGTKGLASMPQWLNNDL